jgi:hypothetical protein
LFLKIISYICFNKKFKMKKLAILFTAFAFASVVFVSCKKTTEGPAAAQGIVVEEKNTSIINKFTGTNCYYCGDWGWPMFTGLIDAHHGVDAVCIGSYSQNSFAQLLINSFATAMDKRLPVKAGYPTFSANFYDAWTNASTLQAMTANIETKISEHKAAAVVANSGLTYTVEGNNIVVNTRTKFFQAATGEYNISVIVLEDKVIANQSGPNGGANASHHKVLRSSNGDWGTMVSSGSVASGTQFDKTITITKDAAWNMANVEIATLLWKKNGTQWDFVNAHLHKN